MGWKVVSITASLTLCHSHTEWIPDPDLQGPYNTHIKKCTDTKWESFWELVTSIDILNSLQAKRKQQQTKLRHLTQRWMLIHQDFTIATFATRNCISVIYCKRKIQPELSCWKTSPIWSMTINWDTVPLRLLQAGGSLHNRCGTKYRYSNNHSTSFDWQYDGSGALFWSKQETALNRFHSQLDIPDSLNDFSSKILHTLLYIVSSQVTSNSVTLSQIN